MTLSFSDYAIYKAIMLAFSNFRETHYVLFGLR